MNAMLGLALCALLSYCYGGVVEPNCSCENLQELVQEQQSEVTTLQLQVKALKQISKNQQDSFVTLLHVLLNGQPPKPEILEEVDDDYVASLIDSLCTFGVRGIPGKDGTDGRDGRDGDDGKDGANGRDGRDGLPGPPGFSGLKGAAGLPGADGKVGSPGTPGAPGVNGAKGEPGKTGAPGAPGIEGPRGFKGAAGDVAALESGAVYTRWGKTSCNSVSTKIYEGFAGGTLNTDRGGGVDYLCLPNNPEYSKYSTVQKPWHGSWISGAEYQSSGYGIFSSNANDQNVPCTRCYTGTRSAVMMIPAKRTCPTGWTEEYEGYLMTAHFGHAHPATYECVDANPQYIRGLEADNRGALFYFVKADCSNCGTTGHCPPYDDKKEITCVVCTK